MDHGVFFVKSSLKIRKENFKLRLRKNQVQLEVRNSTTQAELDFCQSLGAKKTAPKGGVCHCLPDPIFVSGPVTSEVVRAVWQEDLIPPTRERLQESVFSEVVSTACLGPLFCCSSGLFSCLEVLVLSFCCIHLLYDSTNGPPS